MDVLEKRKDCCPCQETNCDSWVNQPSLVTEQRLCMYFIQYSIFTSKLDLNLRKKLVKCYVWSMAVYGAET